MDVSAFDFCMILLLPVIYYVGISDRIWTGKSEVQIPAGTRFFEFPKSSTPILGTIKLCLQWVPGFFPQVKRPRREVEFLIPSNVEIKNEWSCTSTNKPSWHGGGRLCYMTNCEGVGCLRLMKPLWKVSDEVYTEAHSVEDLLHKVKAQKARASLVCFERGFCKHLRLHQRNLKPLTKRVRALRIHTRCFWQ